MKQLFFRLRAPSYFCENETDIGLELHYRSKRRGFTHYTIGQLKAVAETFYKIKLEENNLSILYHTKGKLVYYNIIKNPIKLQNHFVANRIYYVAGVSLSWKGLNQLQTKLQIVSMFA